MLKPTTVFPFPRSPGTRSPSRMGEQHSTASEPMASKARDFLPCTLLLCAEPGVVGCWAGHEKGEGRREEGQERYWEESEEHAEKSHSMQHLSSLRWFNKVWGKAVLVHLDLGAVFAFYPRAADPWQVHSPLHLNLVSTKPCFWFLVKAEREPENATMKPWLFSCPGKNSMLG